MGVRTVSPKLLRISYYKAPHTAAVVPVVIPAKTIVIELVTEGVIYFQTERGDLRLGVGALFWHMPGEETIHRTEPDDPYECLALAFSNVQLTPRPAPRVSRISDQQKVREFSSELVSAYHDDSVDLAILGRYAYSRLLWEAHHASLARSAVGYPASVDLALAFTEENFHRPEIGVADVAGAGRISIPHLHSLFREHLGQTPHDFLNARRIREAKWLLTRTDGAIKNIAAECGFLNIETFYRAFKKTVGMTPLEFRLNTSSPILADL